MSLEGEFSDNNNALINTTKKSLLDILKEKTKLCVQELNNLVSQPYLKYLLIACFADFGLMARYLFQNKNSLY